MQMSTTTIRRSEFYCFYLLLHLIFSAPLWRRVSIFAGKFSTNVIPCLLQLKPKVFHWIHNRTAQFIFQVAPNLLDGIAVRTWGGRRPIIFFATALPTSPSSPSLRRTVLKDTVAPLVLCCWVWDAVLVRSFFLLRIFSCLSENVFFSTSPLSVNCWRHGGLQCTLQYLDCISCPWLCGCNSCQHHKGPLFKPVACLWAPSSP